MTLDAVDPLPRRAARVVLRRFRLVDLESFQAYRADPEVGRYQGWVPMTTDAAIVFINAMSVATLGEADQWMQIAIADPVTDQLIGDIGICVHGVLTRIPKLATPSPPRGSSRGWAPRRCAPRSRWRSSARALSGSSPSPMRETWRRCACFSA